MRHMLTALGGIAALVPGLVVVAQTATPPASATATTPPRMTETSVMSPAELQPFALGVAAALLLALLLLFGYLYLIQQQYYTVFAALERSGVAVSPSPVDPLVAAAPNVAMLPGNLAPPVPPVITGPATVTVGQLSKPFTALVNGTPAPASATWAVHPPTAAALLSLTDGRVQLFAPAAATFHLTASAGNAPSTPYAVKAMVPTPKGGDALPFVGQGYGTLAIVLVLIAAVIVLALRGVLEGQAVATFVGGVLGYIFHQASSGGASNKNSGGPGKTTGGSGSDSAT